MAWTPARIPSLRGKTFVVTGANSGIGLAAARALAARGARVILACRSVEKGRAALDGIRKAHPDAEVTLEALDLSSLSSVRAFAERFASQHARLDVLVNNAGVMALPYQKTADGFEMQLGTNHLGHFALTGLLFDRLAAAPGARVVTVASVAHHFGAVRFADLHGEKSYSPWVAYAQSKLANMLFAHELARRVEATRMPITSVACHPGYASTNLQTSGVRNVEGKLEERLMALGNGIFAQSAEQGALPTVYAATADDVRPADYIGPSGPFGLVGSPTRARTSRRARDAEAAARLWELSEELTGVRFDALAPTRRTG
jgi:NAD(P)-dependent dehydrogenase (short-subunit alcohol dehydrogenase family)